MAVQNTALNAIANNEFAAATLAPDYSLIIAFYALAGLAAIVLDGWALRAATSTRTRFIMRIIAGVLAFAAVFAARTVFYSNQSRPLNPVNAAREGDGVVSRDL